MINKKGFTLVELLAVITVLGVIMVIATTSVMGAIEDSRKKAKFIAAKDIVTIAASVMESKGEDYITVSSLVCGYLNNDVTNPDTGCYLNNDVTNPETGENISSASDLDNHVITKESIVEQTDFELHDNCYNFNGYKYCIN